MTIIRGRGTATSTRSVSDRRDVMELPGDDGEIAYISVWCDGLQIAAGVRQDDYFAEHNGGARWSLWSSGLSLASTSDAPVTFAHSGKTPRIAHPLPVRSERDVRAWLELIADLAERGPRAVEERRS